LRTRLETPFDLACCIAFTAAYKKSIAKFKYKKISICGVGMGIRAYFLIVG
jgi:hypothetical protein